MENVFRDLLTRCWWSWVGLLAAVGLTVALFTSGANREVQSWIAIAAYLCLVLFFTRPLLSAAYNNHHHLLTVCVWSFVLVLLFVVLAFYAFYGLVGDQAAKYDKLLNVVPVFVAIWAAAMGWLVHFRLSTKAQRTNNAFTILMEMRKSSEFLKRSENAGRHFPPGGDIPDTYRPYFPAATLRQLYTAAEAAGTEPSKADLEKAEAVRDLKYVLNYFEFMAVGITARDLDEDLLYDTVSSHVIMLVERARPLIEFIRAPRPNGDGQPLAFIDIMDLYNRWKVRHNNHIAHHQNTGKARVA